MRSTFKVLFYVIGSKEKNGIVPIMGRVTINGSVAQFSCKQSIHKDLWDVKGNRAKGKSKVSRDINLALDNIKAQIIKHYQRISDREAFVTAEMTAYAANPRFGSVARLSFGMPKNAVKPTFRTRKPRSTLRWRQSAPDGRRLGNSIEE